MENPWAIRLPHLAKIKAACQRLQLRACAQLAISQSEGAFKDIELMLNLTDSVKGEPFLITHLVRVAAINLAVQPLWEGLAEHRWSEAQLKMLQTRLLAHNFVADLKRSFAAEKAAGILTADLVKRKGLGYLFEMQGELQGMRSGPASQTLAAAAYWLVPGGWYDMEKVTLCQLHQLLLGKTLDTTNKVVSPRQVALNTRQFERTMQMSGPFGRINAILDHRYLAGMLLPALGKVGLKAAVGQTVADQAALSCALERFRIAQGKFPATLQELTPKFISVLPHDVITGEPFKYQLTGDGQYTLYSIGWNEKDDGGVPGNSIFDERSGDWVWRYTSD
jgi:hypothetical protein